MRMPGGVVADPCRAAQARGCSAAPSRLRRNYLGQIGLGLAGLLFYVVVRVLTDSSHMLAVAHGHDLLRVENLVSLDWERTGQRWAIDTGWALDLANWVYVWGYSPVLVATLVLLYRFRRAAYQRLRNTMVVSGAMALIVFTLYPVAPPRLLPAGYVDSVAEHSSSLLAQPPIVLNEYAALPSLHVTWMLLLGIAVFCATRGLVARSVAILSPLAMAIAVVLTANHYVVDVIAGIVVAVVSVLVVRSAEAGRARALPPAIGIVPTSVGEGDVPETVGSIQTQRPSLLPRAQSWVASTLFREKRPGPPPSGVPNTTKR